MGHWAIASLQATQGALDCMAPQPLPTVSALPVSLVTEPRVIAHDMLSCAARAGCRNALLYT